jgi:hypothetical protein
MEDTMIWFYCVISAIGGAFLTGVFWMLHEAVTFGGNCDADEAGLSTVVVSVVLALVAVAIAGWLR